MSKAKKGKGQSNVSPHSDDTSRLDIIAETSLQAPPNMSVKVTVSGAADEVTTTSDNGRVSKPLGAEDMLAYNNSPFRQVELRYDRTSSVPVDIESIRQEQRFSQEDGATLTTQCPKTQAMKKRSQSASKTKRPLYGVSPHCKFGPKGYLSSATTHHM
ncbi:hypothetical protein PoB_004265900 [Plakobranchus ocellatus]|uniref:Uncharacterized protein n=1 Tax=Plakobranchus ocellatus TaxID=259542 RepID=A0AAV4BCR5_9GAST|nr:hypothetical protein PoB_004265900 [Plakobranchus ocellatus]